MTHTNALGYSILPPSMASKVFGEEVVKSYHPEEQTNINEIITQMEGFGVEFPIKNPPTFTNLPEFNLPQIQGENISEHFKLISEGAVGEQKKLLTLFANSVKVGDPPPPEEIRNYEGWTSYKFDGTSWACTYLGEKGLEGVPIAVFDCETFVQGSEFGHPILATAVDMEGTYYVWMHESFCDSSIPYTEKLVPLGTTNSILVAHNVGFDRQRTVEAYYLHHDPLNPDKDKRFGNLWFDTMSAHINVSGLASEQRFWFKEKASKFSIPPSWSEKGSLNNLIDTYNFHCNPEKKLSKDTKNTRNLFVVAKSMSDFDKDKPELVAYALKDVQITFDLFSIVCLKYLQSNPSLTTLYGHFAQTSAILPVSPDWNEWVEGCERVWEQSIDRQNELLKELALQLLEDWKNDEVDVESDPWYKQLDWTADHALKKNGTPKSVWYGVPVWFRKNASRNKETGAIVLNPITTKSRISHLLLRLRWKGQPIFYTEEKGWQFFDEEKGVSAQIPHVDGEGVNVGGVLSKDYLPDFESGILSSDLPQAQELLQLAIRVSYWTSVRSRVKKQLPTKSNDTGLTIIIPSTIPHNTATNRSGENLWLTVPDPKPEKIGTEVKTRVQVSSPYTFVSSDYDGQEGVVASIFADSVYKIAGSTQFGHSVLAGSKDDGTDMHSMTAKTIGISRSISKNCNYGMLYGSGISTLASTIRKGNKNISLSKAKGMAKTLITKKKGKKENGVYYGGSDSFAYNEMTRIANLDIPLNPLSGTRMSTAFRPSNVGENFFTMRNNWVIQSTGSAMLHAFLTAMEYLTHRYGVSARFCISVHDSVLYMCREEDADVVAALYQVAHLWSWAWLRYNYGIYEMPHANAWFSSIEIDKIFRKSATASTLTISQTRAEPDGRAHTIASLVPVLESLRAIVP
jgi:DNA polymerase gamma 1